MKSSVGLGLLLVAFLSAGPLAAQLESGGSPIDPGPTESLMDIYQRALQSDPAIREAEATYRADIETRPQARAALLPQISGSANHNWSEARGTSIFETVQDGQIVTQSTEFEQTGRSLQWNVQLRQTLFRWDQWVNFRQSEKRVAQAELRLEAARRDLMLRASEAYFNVLSAQDVLASAQAAREAIGEQLEQAERRFEVGLSAITDVQEAQAAYDRSVADEIAAQRALASSREGLRELTADYVMDLAALDEELPLEPPEPQQPDLWVETAMAQNLDLLAARINAEIAGDNVSIARTGHYPTLDLVIGRSASESRTERSNNQGPFRPTDSDNRNESISLQLSVPLFSGGATSSRVRESVYRHRASRDAVERISRQTERQTRDAYLGVESDISRVQALRQTVRSSQIALDAAETGLEVGTRTTVDVLNARRQLFQAQTDYARARYDYLINSLRLKQAAGILEIEDLEEIDAWLLN